MFNNKYLNKISKFEEKKICPLCSKGLIECTILYCTYSLEYQRKTFKYCCTKARLPKRHILID